MLFRVISAALFAAVAGVHAADAQSVRSIGGPAELPPPSYKGQSYVDSRGCVFLRAGYGGTVSWVARVTRDRKPLCGYPRTQTAGTSPAPVPRAVPAPAQSPAATTVARAAAPVTASAPSPRPEPTVITGPSAPVAAAPVQVARAAAPQLRLGGGAAPSPAPAPTVIPGPGSRAAPAPVAVAAAPAPAYVGDSTAIYAQLHAQERAARPTPLVVPGGVSSGASGGMAAGMAMACDPSVPVAKRFRTNDGRSVVLCTRGDGSLDGIQAPIIASASGFAAWQLQGAVEAGGKTYYSGGGASVVPAPSTRAASAARASAARASGARATGPAQVQVAPGVTAPAIASARGYDAWMLGTKGGAVTYSDPSTVPGVTHVPKGYRPAWRDGRLNPMRGYGTIEGQMQQDMVWTREVPARLVPRDAVPRRVVVVSSKSTALEPAAPKAAASKVSVSAKATPKATVNSGVKSAGQGGIYVQIGTFGQPANADAAKARLRAAGLPIGTAKITRGGQAMQIVLTGPFADGGSARSALNAARRAGFADAFIR
ncbi:SPOR domain-containing protein [Aliigemmobacter aestuarii]|uniref:SPOR domain-containing protein n=1 Tax=Aliigemmobacter aestuarii TaxID=1445661 RepID=A0A4S3MJD1_9RHOB|nr:SPOR domain-containing protein [Gemmobacter aestuarii]THD81487.1 SPOR domain-containing protein [Gemmobacter aestuarii]